MSIIGRPQILELPMTLNSKGQELTVYTDFPIWPTRIFWINGLNENDERGNHAHLECNQFFVCMNGEAIIKTRTPQNKTYDSFLLCSENPHLGLYVPNHNWVKVIVTKPKTNIMVICDTLYKEDDYIRTEDQFDSLQ
jgi:hypothetical protein